MAFVSRAQASGAEGLRLWWVRVAKLRASMVKKSDAWKRPGKFHRVTAAKQLRPEARYRRLEIFA